jgi:hypothetical protein
VARKGAKRRRRPEELRGEWLSYGEPVTVGGRTVITVTRVRASGAGKARAVDATPVGYIEMTADGSAYHPIEDPRRGLRVAATAATTVVGLLAGARALRASRRPVRLLPPGRR